MCQTVPGRNVLLVQGFALFLFPLSFCRTMARVITVMILCFSLLATRDVDTFLLSFRTYEHTYEEPIRAVFPRGTAH